MSPVPAPSRRQWLALSVGGLCLPSCVNAQSVSLAGAMGNKALLVIDGQPHTVAVGETVKGVTVLQLNGQQAQLRRQGETLQLTVGGSPVNVGGGQRVGNGKQEIVLPAGPGGHFLSEGAINGASVRFMVDTGATMVALSQAEAERAQVDWRRGERGMGSTANGNVMTHVVSLSRVRVGPVELNNIRAVVLPQPMPYVLLGNSFLSRFSMRRDADVMRLELRA
jgi:aspartyl protease family protein